MKTMTITRWIYNEKAAELKEGIAPVNETKGTVEIEVVEIVKETEKAICIATYDYQMNIVKVWLPRTQIKDSNCGIKTLEREKTDYTEYGKYDSAVEAEKIARNLQSEGKKAFVKYVKNDCIVMVG